MPPPRRRTRKRPSGGKGGSRRGRPGGSSNRRSFKEFRDRNRPSPSKRTTSTFDDSGRESGIRAASTTTRADKKKSLEQSIGSLDRRINNALKDNNLDLVKDLRSRQNRFVKNLGFFNATNTAGGVARTNDGRIIRTSDGSPVLTNAGLAAFNKTIDRDFLNPTRKLINENPKAYAAMYPVTDQLRQGLPGIRVAKEFLGMDDKQQKYTDAQMPGQRYALDKDFGAGEGMSTPEIMDDEIIADDFDKRLDVAPDAVPLDDLGDSGIISPTDADPNTPGLQKPPKTVPDPANLLELLFDANRNEPGIQIFNPNPQESDKFPSIAPDLFKNIGAAFDADPNTPGVQIFNPNPSGNRNVNMQVKEPSGPMIQVDENPFISGTQVSGDNFFNQVANNTTIMKENIANSNLTADQKQVLLNEVDNQMKENVSGLDMLTSDAPVSLPQVVDQQLDNANPASEAAALEILNSLSNNQNRGFNISGLFDANPNVPGVQIFNTNPNRNAVNNQGGGFSLADLFDANPDQEGFQLFNFNRNR